MRMRLITWKKVFCLRHSYDKYSWSVFFTAIDFSRNGTELRKYLFLHSAKTENYCKLVLLIFACAPRHRLENRNHFSKGNSPGIPSNRRRLR